MFAGILPLGWWLLVLAYFLVDVLLLLGTMFLLRMLSAGDPSQRESFWCETAGIVPVWFLLHLSLLLFEFPVYTRLESVGLGKLEGIGFAAFLISGAAYLLRSISRQEVR
jgi:hypothetical protein